MVEILNLQKNSDKIDINYNEVNKAIGYIKSKGDVDWTNWLNVLISEIENTIISFNDSKFKWIEKWDLRDFLAGKIKEINVIFDLYLHNDSISRKTVTDKLAELSNSKLNNVVKWIVEQKKANSFAWVVKRSLASLLWVATNKYIKDRNDALKN